MLERDTFCFWITESFIDCSGKISYEKEEDNEISAATVLCVVG